MMRPLNSAAEIESEFREAMHAVDLVTPYEIVADGQLHRFHVQGDRPGTTNGWYILHPDGRPAGCYGNWKTGISGTWCAGTGKPLNKAEKAIRHAQLEKTRQLRAAALHERHAQAAKSAEFIWCGAKPANNDFPYLLRKGITDHSLRESDGRLIIPMMAAGNELRGLQFISADGEKRFLPGTKKRGSFYLLGDPAEDPGNFSTPPDPLLIVEGYATGATIRAATGLPVVVAFDSGNLEPVAMLMASAFSPRQIVIAADNDRETLGNPGLKFAKKAADVVGGKVIYPQFMNEHVGSDWNDYARLYGMTETRAAFMASLGNCDDQ